MFNKPIFVIIISLMIFAIAANFQKAFGTQPESQRTQSTDEPMATLMNINKLAMWVQADGFSARNPHSQDRSAIQWGVLYPRGKPLGVVFVDGLVWGGFVQDGQEPVLRVGGHGFRIGLQPGAIHSPGIAEHPNDPQVNRVWRYRPDWQTADLDEEAFDILASRPGASNRDFEFTEAELQSVADSLRAAYDKDLNEWPWQKGAPFYDLNGNGIMDEGEEPGLVDSDQVVWYVVNDLNAEKTLDLYGSPPIGIEMQVTLWAYDDDVNIENTIFRRMRLIYKGTSHTLANSHIDNMAVGLYSEVDVGSAGDDFAGTDTTLQMVFAYNSTTLDPAYREFDSAPPALRYTLLQGPIVHSSDMDDVARFHFSERRGYRNLRMTGAWVDGAGDTDSQPSLGVYDGTLQYYNVLNGFRPRPENPPSPFINPITNTTTRFTQTGDPTTNTGWIDVNPGNRQETLTTANFSMALGDTQEVIIAMTAGLGSDRLASIEVMKFFARYARDFAYYNFVTAIEESEISSVPEKFQLFQNFPNPFNASTRIRYSLDIPSDVQLKVYNLRGQEIETLINATQGAGEYEFQWTPIDLSSAVYVYRLRIKNNRFFRKKVETSG